MVKIEPVKKDGYKYCFKLSLEGGEFFCYMTRDNFLCVDGDSPLKETLLRVLINKCINEFEPEVCAYDVWDTRLEDFGFERAGDKFVSGYLKLKLPGCGDKR